VFLSAVFGQFEDSLEFSFYGLGEFEWVGLLAQCEQSREPPGLSVARCFEPVQWSAGLVVAAYDA